LRFSKTYIHIIIEFRNVSYQWEVVKESTALKLYRSEQTLGE